MTERKDARWYLPSHTLVMQPDSRCEAVNSKRASDAKPEQKMRHWREVQGYEPNAEKRHCFGDAVHVVHIRSCPPLLHFNPPPAKNNA